MPQNGMNMPQRQILQADFMKTIIITGGAGFIGSHLCDALIKDYKIICIDKFITGQKSNVAHLLSNKNFVLIEHDVTKQLKITGDVHYIFHLASPASPVDYQLRPIETMLANSFGTYNMLELACEKKARILLASTSEVYGDPKEHPQKETYWGNVNCVGPRSCYDESKRFAEALAMSYLREHKTDVRVARIFNSILADEKIIVFNDNDLHLDTIEEYTNSIGGHEIVTEVERNIFVPAFDLNTCKMALYRVSAVIKHPCVTDCYEISLRYGKKIKVTGDHSLFTKDRNEKPVAIPVRNLKQGDYIAIPARIPAVEKDFKWFSISRTLIDNCKEPDLWNYLIIDPALRKTIIERRQKINELLLNSGRFKAKRHRNAVVCASNRYKHMSFLPLWVVKKLNIPIPNDAKIRIFAAGAHIITPDRIAVTDEILWLIGLYLAEGCSVYKEGKNYFLTFSSDGYLLDKAKKILEKNFGVHVIKVPYQKARCPAIFIHSKILHFIFDRVFKVVNAKGFPSWILQLPLSRLKYVLEGFKDGDGTHSGKKLGNELCFDTTSKKLADDLTFLLLRFGIVASVGQYTTTFKRKYGERKFPFYRLTVCELSTFNILQWDACVTQKLNAKRTGDLVWSMVKEIKKCPPTKYVYDFSVPKAENFIAGNGICCHNTYGPRMRENDGRVIPNFISQALQNKPITVYGKGDQTRSFGYVSDLVEGLKRLMFSESLAGEVINLGNPEEYTVLETAEIIKEITNSSSEIVFRDLPQDDPLRRNPDISKAKKLLLWEPKISFEEGIKKTIGAFKHKL